MDIYDVGCPYTWSFNISRFDYIYTSGYHEYSGTDFNIRSKNDSDAYGYVFFSFLDAQLYKRFYGEII